MQYNTALNRIQRNAGKIKCCNVFFTICKHAVMDYNKTRTCFGCELTLAGLAPNVANPNIENCVQLNKTRNITFLRKAHILIQQKNNCNTKVCGFAVKLIFWSCNLPTFGCGRPSIRKQMKSLCKIGDNTGLIMQPLLFAVYVNTFLFIIFLIFH